LPAESAAVTAAATFDDALDAFRSGDLGRARDVASRAAESSPSGELQHLLGLIECRSGNVGAGVDWLRQACESDPANIGFKVMLARALVDSGRAAEALDVAAPPTGTTPPELALWHARAEAADAADNPEAAVEAWGQLCRAGVANWRAWANYGKALATMERWVPAEAAFRQAMAIDPAEPTVRRDLAISLARQGRQNEAADELLQWSEEASADRHSRVLLARLLSDLDRDDEAMGQFNRVMQEATGKPFDDSGERLVAAATSATGQIDLPLLVEIARLMERTNRTEALRKLLEDAEAAGLKREQLAYPAAALALRDGDPQEAKRLLKHDRPYGDPLRAHRLMARIADALDDPATAFAEAEEMNACATDRDKWLRNGKRYIESVRAVAKAITPEWAARVKPLDPPERGSPVFLVGFPRSGTTLLDTFLMGHPDTMVLEEMPMVTEAQKQLGEGPDLPDRRRAEIEKARDAYYAALDRYVPAGFDRLVIDKLPLNLLAPRFIHMMFPDAKFIFAQRHPCDSVLSCLMQPFALTDSMACFLQLDTAADFYDAAMTVWTKCNDVLPLNVHRLVYEDLIADQEATLRPLVEFLGLEWRDELLDHRATAKKRGVISTPSYDQVVQPISKRPSGRWRRYKDQLAPVLPVLLPWAQRFGYPE
jgi:Flp pilus assembly protein TadD